MSSLLKMFSLGIPFDTGIIQMAYGEFLAALGRKEDAARHFKDAAGSFRRSGATSLAEDAEKMLAGLS